MYASTRSFHTVPVVILFLAHLFSTGTLTDHLHLYGTGILPHRISCIVRLKSTTMCDSVCELVEPPHRSCHCIISMDDNKYVTTSWMVVVLKLKVWWKNIDAYQYQAPFSKYQSLKAAAWWPGFDFSNMQARPKPLGSYHHGLAWPGSQPEAGPVYSEKKNWLLLVLAS